jgi:hypothetical protein
MCLDEGNGGWLVKNVPALRDWQGSRLKIVGLDALPKYRRVVAWFPGPVEGTELYQQRLRRLNRGLNTDNWKAYELMEESNGVRLVFRIDSTCITALKRLRWLTFSGVVRKIFSH